ncbi:PREDICTED: complement C5-like isoform X2 [Chinchilla lanigera]|uniref:complement C5-like isoform X2 n=1 Tax=Chinchilla lanigera TaxID=34839 RepID=UPI000696CBB2|nr:PREDICTED: complement C5-like isoform X2 [Chinchilla lanigera]
MGIFTIVCLCFYLGGSWGQQQVYVISAPKVFYLGTSENVVIQAYGYIESFSVILAVKSYPDKSFTYSFDRVDLSPENKFQNSANLIIQPKDLSGGLNAVSHVYLEVVSIHFSKERKIPLRYDNGFLFIQTDRPVYNLDQPVKVRVYSLDKDLKPSPREVILTFIDPEGLEVATVEEKNHTGIITFPDFKIQSNPKYGSWTIKAKYKEDFTTTGTASFEIKSSDNFFKETKRTDVKYGLPPYTLDLVSTPLSLKPGIPYFIKVQVKDAFAHFVGGIPVILKAKIVDKTQEKRELDPRKSITNYHDGIASFMVNIPTGVTALEFHVRTDNPDLPEQYQASNDYQAVTYSSPSQSFLSLTWTGSQQSLLVGEYLSITITPESPYLDKITHYNYLISSKGKIVHFGTEERIPASSSQILNLPVTQHMVPTAHLLVYYIIPGELTAELVSDTLCLNTEEKCGNQLQIHLSPRKDVHFPGEAVSLIMETQSELWVALTASDSGTYGIQGRGKSPMERVFGAAGKIDQGCGASGGRSNAEVFSAAGLTVLTNANAEDSQQIDGSHKNINRSRRSLKEEIDNLASQFRHPTIQKCCYDGAHKSEENCTERAARITVGPRCVAAFSQCCSRASELRGDLLYKTPLLGRAPGLPENPILVVQVPAKTVLENWLWGVHHVSKRHQMEVVLPDFLTTWEIQGIGISDKGLCVADVLRLHADEDHVSVINNNITRLNEKQQFLTSKPQESK